jgi:hypothetical protein
LPGRNGKAPLAAKGAHAHTIGRSLEQLVLDYIRLADADQAARDLAEFRRLSREARERWAERWERLSGEAQGSSRSWKFNREEIYDLLKARRREESSDG